jgi:hypothetical protein
MAVHHLNDGASIVITGFGVWVKGFPAYGTGRKPVVLKPEVRRSVWLRHSSHYH